MCLVLATLFLPLIFGKELCFLDEVQESLWFGEEPSLLATTVSSKTYYRIRGGANQEMNYHIHNTCWQHKGFGYDQIAFFIKLDSQPLPEWYIPFDSEEILPQVCGDINALFKILPQDAVFISDLTSPCIHDCNERGYCGNIVDLHLPEPGHLLQISDKEQVSGSCAEANHIIFDYSVYYDCETPCESGYWGNMCQFSGHCADCHDPLHCDGNEAGCTTCGFQYDTHNSTCQTCPDNCRECSEVRGKCSACDSGFYVNFAGGCSLSSMPTYGCEYGGVLVDTGSEFLCLKWDTEMSYNSSKIDLYCSLAFPSGGKVVMPKSESYFQNIGDQFLLQDERGICVDSFWIGLRDSDVEGEFKWEDGDAFTLPPSHWGADQPDDWTPGEDCVLFTAHGDGDHAIRDVNCFQDSHCVGCEFPPVVTVCDTVPNCLACIADSNVCEICYETFEVSNGDCVREAQLTPSCEECGGNGLWKCDTVLYPSLCDSCDGFYQHANGECDQNPECSDCSSPTMCDGEVSGCQSCGFFFSEDEKCVDCYVDNCLKCLDETRCDVCQPGFFLSYVGTCQAGDISMCHVLGGEPIESVCVFLGDEEQSYSKFVDLKTFYCELNWPFSTPLMPKTEQYYDSLVGYFQSSVFQYSAFWLGMTYYRDAWMWYDTEPVSFFDDTVLDIDNTCVSVNITTGEMYSKDCHEENYVACQRPPPPFCETIENCVDCSYDPNVCSSCFETYTSKNMGEECERERDPSCEECQYGYPRIWMCDLELYPNVCQNCGGWYFFEATTNTSAECIENPGCSHCYSKELCIGDKTGCEGCNWVYSSSTDQCVDCGVDDCLVCMEGDPSRCQTCDGFGLYVSDQGLCEACNDIHCLVCDADRCLECSSEDGYYLNYVGECEFDSTEPSRCSTIPNCAVCADNPQVCTQCRPTYVNESGICVRERLPECDECVTNQKLWKCLPKYDDSVCQDSCVGWSVVGNECVECFDPNCLNCNSAGISSCEVCDETYVVWAGSCLDCPSNCYYCEGIEKCDVCKPGYSLNYRGKCQYEYAGGNCETIPNCKSCPGGIQCVECFDTYGLVAPANTSCQRNRDPTCNECFDSYDIWQCDNSLYGHVCDDSCEGYSFINQNCEECLDEKCVSCSLSVTNCTECERGSFLKEGDCFKCVSNCLQCSALEVCEICSPGYFLNFKRQCEYSSWSNCDIPNCKECTTIYDEQLGFNIENCTECFAPYISNETYCELSRPPLCEECLGDGKYNSTLQRYTNRTWECEHPVYDNVCHDVCVGRAMIDDQCTECVDSNCLVCDPNPQCGDGYFLKNYFLKPDACEECGANCLRCDIKSNQVRCLECAPGSYMSFDGSCGDVPYSSPCLSIPNCEYCGHNGLSNYCSRCFALFEFDHAKRECVLSRKPHCHECYFGDIWLCDVDEHPGICNECIGWDFIDNLCLKCIDSNCLSCSPNPDICVDCAVGYIRNFRGKCKKCPANCNQCVFDHKNRTECTICAPGFYLNHVGQCIGPYKLCSEYSECLHFNRRWRATGLEMKSGNSFCELERPGSIPASPLNSPQFNSLVRFVHDHYKSTDPFWIGLDRDAGSYPWFYPFINNQPQMNSALESSWASGQGKDGVSYCVNVDSSNQMHDVSCSATYHLVCQDMLCETVPNCLKCGDPQVCEQCISPYELTYEGKCILNRYPKCRDCVINREWRCTGIFHDEMCDSCGGWRLNRWGECVSKAAGIALTSVFVPLGSIVAVVVVVVLVILLVPFLKKKIAEAKRKKKTLDNDIELVERPPPPPPPQTNPELEKEPNSDDDE